MTHIIRTEIDGAIYDTNGAVRTVIMFTVRLRHFNFRPTLWVGRR